jgi:hypothetical protein
MLTSNGALVLRAGCRSEDSLVDAFGRELPGIARGVAASGAFRGKVRVDVDAAAFPDPGARRMRVAALEQMLRELAATKGLRGPDGKRVRVQVRLENDERLDDSSRRLRRRAAFARRRALRG